MTRFLDKALAGADEDARRDVPGAGPAGSLNQETERLFAYHHATKHTYHSVRATAHFLDWRNQPDPFRVYHGARVILLERNPGFPEVGTFETIAALGEGSKESGEAVRLDARWLSRLLWHSMAISAWKLVPQTDLRYSLRVNPSSGNLHPTETHLALRDFEGLDDGIYHYRADLHALEHRGRGDWVGELARVLEQDAAAPTANVALIAALTSVFWREAWKYRDRAYRYCCHDLGHALMSLLIAARALGLRGRALAHFADVRLAQELGLENSDEAPLAFLIFDAPAARSRSDAGGRQSAEPLAGIPNELSEEEVPYYLLLGMHRSTVLPEKEAEENRPQAAAVIPGSNPREAGSSPSVPTSTSSASSTSRGMFDAPLGMVARRRRSALDFDPATPPMERADFELLLDYATRDWPADWRGKLDAQASTTRRCGRDFVEFYIYAHRIAGLEPGVFRWRAAERQLVALHRGNVQRVAAYLSLEQPLAGNACFAMSLIANLEAAARLYGNRGYRYVHFEAGAIGQRLYLGAEALGWNATGIGAFYDDDVHRYLGLFEEGGAAVEESAYAAEQAALVQLAGEALERVVRRGPAREVKLSESHEEQRARSAAKTPEPANAGRDVRMLPRQAIYHFAVGRAVKDPRLEASVEER